MSEHSLTKMVRTVFIFHSSSQVQVGINFNKKVISFAFYVKILKYSCINYSKLKQINFNKNVYACSAINIYWKCDTMYKLPTSPKICASTNSKWQIEPSTHALPLACNESLNSHNHDCNIYTARICSKCPPRALTKRLRRTETTHQERVKGLNHAVYWICGASVYARAFVLEADISSIRCTDDVTCYTFDDFWDITASRVSS